MVQPTKLDDNDLEYLGIQAPFPVPAWYSYVGEIVPMPSESQIDHHTQVGHSAESSVKRIAKQIEDSV